MKTKPKTSKQPKPRRSLDIVRPLRVAKIGVDCDAVMLKGKKGVMLWVDPKKADAFETLLCP